MDLQTQASAGVKQTKLWGETRTQAKPQQQRCRRRCDYWSGPKQPAREVISVVILADVVVELGGDVRPPHHHLRPARLGGQGLRRPAPRRVEGDDLGDITLVHNS